MSSMLTDDCRECISQFGSCGVGNGSDEGKLFEALPKHVETDLEVNKVFKLRFENP